MKLTGLGLSRPYRGPERRRSTPEEREQWAREHPPSGRNGWRRVAWAVVTALAVAAALGASAWVIHAGPFYWSLQARVPSLEQRVDAQEKASREKLDRILEILEEQRKEQGTRRQER